MEEKLELLWNRFIWCLKKSWNIFCSRSGETSTWSNGIGIIVGLFFHSWFIGGITFAIFTAVPEDQWDQFFGKFLGFFDDLKFKDLPEFKNVR